MSSAGSVPSAMGNGAPYNGRHQTQHQTPADMVGNQFVSQFYTVLHSSPRYLHRFYTDDSTVTHADCGIDGEPPTSQTVTTQKGISDRVLAMGFEEAVTEIWSVDSQYSQNNGVMVMVTGSLQCKGKKKRDFVQSFFLAVQEKGYFVLNDTFRYLSDRASRPNQYHKENGYIPHDYSKGYSQIGSYQQAQHAYYPGQLPAHAAAVSNAYSTHVPQVAYPVPAPAPPVSTAPQRDITRGLAVTPSMPQRDHATSLAPPKATAPPPTASVQQQQQASTTPPPAAPQPQAPVPHTAPPAQISAPNTAPSAPTAAAPHQTTQEVPKQAEPSITAAPSQKNDAPAASEAPVQPAPQAKPEPKESKTEPASKPEEQPKPAEPAAPTVPLTYAERLKLGASAAPSKAAPTKPQQAPAQPQPATAAKVGEPVVESSSEAPHAAQPPPETVGATADDSVTTSIFVRDFPEGVTPEKLEAAFSRFGPIRGGVQGINLRQQKGKEDFAFVEFEELAAMQASIEGQVIIDGKTVTVVERRPMFPRNLRGAGYQRREGGRGDGRGFRGGPGRGDRGRGGRGEGARPYTGGRGDGRAEGRGGGRGRSFESFQGDSRGEGGRGARGDGGRGRGPGGRQPRGAPQSAPPTRPQQA